MRLEGKEYVMQDGDVVLFASTFKLISAIKRPGRFPVFLYCHSLILRISSLRRSMSIQLSMSSSCSIARR